MQVECFNDFEIKNLTTFKIGGKVAKVYFPKNVDEFVFVLESEPFAKVVGNLSNTLVSTSGYNGVVISTSKMKSFKIEQNLLTADAGIKGPFLAKQAAENGLSGIEFMIGFPGSVGGEVCMNASANGQSISNCVKKVKLYSSEKGVFVLSKDEMEFSYRNSICQKMPYIVLSAEFELTPAPREEIGKRMQDNLNFRKNHQPSLVLPNCGSVFKNQNGDSAGRLLELAGAKELQIGGARVWENHANFIVNDRACTSEDVLNLMFDMYSMVKNKFGIELEPEVRFLGGNNENEVKLCKILYRN